MRAPITSFIRTYVDAEPPRRPARVSPFSAENSVAPGLARHQPTSLGLARRTQGREFGKYGPLRLPGPQSVFSRAARSSSSGASPMLAAICPNQSFETSL